MVSELRKSQYYAPEQHDFPLANVNVTFASVGCLF